MSEDARSLSKRYRAMSLSDDDMPAELPALGQTERRRAALAFGLIADMAGDGSSTMESIRNVALKHMLEFRDQPAATPAS